MWNYLNHCVISVNSHAGATLMSWLSEFFFLLALTQHSQDLEKSACGRNPKADEASRGVVNSYRPIFLLCVPYKILEKLIYACVEPTIDPCSLESRLNFDEKNQRWIKSFY